MTSAGGGTPGGGAAATSSGGSAGASGGKASAGAGGALGGSAGAALGGSAGASGAVGQGGAAGGSGGATSAGSAGMGGATTAFTWKNPILPGYNADPQIAAFDGNFYIYPTTDGFANWLGTKFHAWSSSDLREWKDEGVVLDLGPGVSWADEKAWAPGIAFKGGTYYFYFSAGQAIGVATGTSPVGPFKDALGHELVKTGAYGVQAIDPYAFTDDDGRSYLYFGSSSSARVVELNDDMVSFKGTPQTITIGGFREGSVAFKRNGKYYFMYSVGDTRDAAYNVAYGMASSPFGPFTKPAVNPVLARDDARGILGTGHHSILAMPNGDYYIAYHRFAIPDGDGTHREVCLDKLEFNADGTIVPVKTTR
jgi:beta-xylosidase